MAAKKKSPVTSILEIGAVLLIAYFAYKLLFGKKVSAATGYGSTGSGIGGYGATSSYPYQTTQQATQNPLSALGQMLASLLGKGGSSGGGGSSAGSGSGATPIASNSRQTPAQLKQEYANINGLLYQANSTSNPELGGYSLLSLPAGYGASGVDLGGYTIPNVPGPSLFDFGSSSYAPSGSDPWASIGGYLDSSYSNPMDTSSIDLGNLAGVSYGGQVFDFGSQSYDPGVSTDSFSG